VRLTLEAVSLLDERTIGAHQLPRGSYVTLSVCDSGPGISPEVLQRLFEPYFTTKDFSAGSGLGLAVCEGIVSAHRGAIDVESRLGEGACFRVWLPASEIAALRNKVGPTEAAVWLDPLELDGVDDGHVVVRCPGGIYTTWCAENYGPELVAAAGGPVRLVAAA
jgi:hypothetical protein